MMADAERERSWSRIARWGIGLLAVAIVGMVLWSLLQPDPVFAPLPNPNGHDDLVRAATLVVGALPGRTRPRDAGAEELRAFVEPNAEARALLRRGLGRECGVPLAATLEAQNVAGVQATGPVRMLGRLLESEGWLARKEGRKDDAIHAGLDLVRLGQASSRGGLMIHRLTGDAVVWVGVDFLARLRPELSAGDCRRIVRELEAEDARREPLAEVITRERTFARRKAPLVLRVHLAFRSSPVSRLLKTSEQGTEFGDLRTEAHLRLLIAELAVQAHRLEHEGADPATLADLIPRDLAAVPIDPFTGQPLHYRKQDSGARLLYSLGPDRKDDGGTPVAQWTPQSRGDLRLESR